MAMRGCRHLANVLSCVTPATALYYVLINDDPFALGLVIASALTLAPLSALAQIAVAAYGVDWKPRLIALGFAGVHLVILFLALAAIRGR